MFCNNPSKQRQKVETNYQAGSGHKKDDTPRIEDVIGSEAHQAIDVRDPSIHLGHVNVSPLTPGGKAPAQASSSSVAAPIDVVGESILVVPLVATIVEPVQVSTPSDKAEASLREIDDNVSKLVSPLFLIIICFRVFYAFFSWNNLVRCSGGFPGLSSSFFAQCLTLLSDLTSNIGLLTVMWI